MIPFVVALLLWAVTVEAQSCPSVTAHVYGTNDGSCGGSYNSIVLRNNSCNLVNGGYNSLKLSRANAQVWADNCFILDIVQNFCPWTGGAYVPSGYTPSNGTSGNTVDYATCLPATGNPDAQHPTLMYMICWDPKGAVTGCQPSGVGPTTTPKPTTTPTPIPTSTPSPTNTRTANPYLISAISLASSAISVASRSVSAYTANPNETALASAAETALESAAVVNQNALNLASDYSAKDIVSRLKQVDSILIDAAADAIAAEAAPEIVAAEALAEAFGPAIAAIVAAKTVAANPTSDPAPAVPPTSSPITSAAVCTLNFLSSDEALDLPSPTDTGVGPGSATIDPTTSSAGASANAKATLQPPIDVDLKRGKFCSQSWYVPAYDSSGTGRYSPYYNYYASNVCAAWSFIFDSSMTDTFPPSPQPGLQLIGPPPGSNRATYASEHIYEIQEVSLFLEYARKNVPILQQFDANAASNVMFCSKNPSTGQRGLGQLMSIARDFVVPASATTYDLTVPPIQQVYYSLDGAGGNTAEFVSLEYELNGLKGNLFRQNNINFRTDADSNLAVATRAYELYEYLNQDHVSQIYKAVSNRVRQQMYNFGQACNSSNAQSEWKYYGNIQWNAVYDAWESGYISYIQNRIVNLIADFTSQANFLLEQQLAGHNSPQAQMQNEMLRARIQFMANDLQARVNLDKLRRS